MLGQGNHDVIAGIIGLLAGSYIYAEASAKLGETVEKWGDRGSSTLPQMLHVPTTGFIIVFAPILILALVAIDRFVAVR